MPPLRDLRKRRPRDSRRLPLVPSNSPDRRSPRCLLVHRRRSASHVRESPFRDVRAMSA
jgi:hypothetical protein